MVSPNTAQQRDEQESLDVWGFADTRFFLNGEGIVEVSGDRYPLSGKQLPRLLPWMEEVLQVTIKRQIAWQPHVTPSIEPARQYPAFVTDLGQQCPNCEISFEDKDRLRHGHGHTQEEMYCIKYASLDRIPDMVLRPSCEQDVITLTELAKKHDVVLIPFGGGTSVTQALMCPANERRVIASVDMRRMNKLLWLDPINRTACIEAGVVGRDLVTKLAERGFTMGHEPDSIEFSTLGGWIATNASGMKKNRYGNIESLVLDVRAVTSEGLLNYEQVVPRQSVGTDTRQLMFGSEGRFGIITAAVVKLFPLPAVQRYNSLLFPDFATGVSFLYQLTQQGKLPASVRLVDNLQFQFGMALKPLEYALPQRLKSQLERWYVTKWKQFAPEQMVACTLVHEGSEQEVAEEERRVIKLATAHGGIASGAANGQRGYQLTFGIAYIRDFIMCHQIVAESFETTVPWSRVHMLIDRVRQCVTEQHEERQLPGKPFLTARVTQLYDTGVCVYFYYGFYAADVPEPHHVFSAIETEIRHTILACGGSLSHHHGVGKLRQQFLPQIMSDAALKLHQATKDAIDPTNMFGCANQTVA